MATLEDGIIRVVDAAGVPINGGKLRIYNTGTTTLSTVWANAALSTPLTNPVVADSAGRLPQIFGADGLVVDCKMLTAANVELSDTAFTKSFSGDTSGDIYRDFTSARFQITKIAGEVEIEAGDPTGDDVGGTMRLGGWEKVSAVRFSSKSLKGLRDGGCPLDAGRHPSRQCARRSDASLLAGWCLDGRSHLQQGCSCEFSGSL